MDRAKEIDYAKEQLAACGFVRVGYVPICNMVAVRTFRDSDGTYLDISEEKVEFLIPPCNHGELPRNYSASWVGHYGVFFDTEEQAVDAARTMWEEVNRKIETMNAMRGKQGEPDLRKPIDFGDFLLTVCKVKYTQSVEAI